ncbi:DM13 domain-containing protein [uncultured Fibrella sp.]|uniref:DM13 domain-containing protein n=1 Tax=uncultured Fibrella sp. TaxID=1284596 RepID=UPI0035CBE52C
MISYLSIALLLLTGVLAGCRSTEATVDPAPVVITTPQSSTTTTKVTIDSTGQVLRSKGLFMNGVHTVRGTVRVYEKDGKQSLVFTDFQSDGGPDLRIYLAETTGLRNFIEVSRLTNSGNFSVELPAGADPAKQRYVLIWCKAFSVLFGTAELI